MTDKRKDEMLGSVMANFKLNDKVFRSVVQPFVADFYTRTLDEFIMHVFISGVAFGMTHERAK